MFGQSEIQNLHTGRRHHDVARLQVAMDDRLGVGCRQGVGDLDAITQRLVQRQNAFFHSRRQGLALDVLHHQISAAFMLANVVKAADVGMV